ncbi:hypothetical protein [Streptomyces sp. MBT53]|uniref:hypothetical protein n=1 Tax=Streptomyces sp. MBT53 TaxID=1488384 RepID=UPI0019125191|nr:hypothetical protein [Streptomyces sp. MBT53]MBK6015616.1 hypothetical protein [Streptomyces sp. MBT53]
MTTPAPSSTAPSGQPQGDPSAPPSGQTAGAPAPAPTAPPTPAAVPQQQPAPAPQPAPVTPPAPTAPAPVPAEQPQPPQSAPVPTAAQVAPAVEGDISRLPQWAQRAITDSQTVARTAAVQTAVLQAAPAAGADPLALLDSVSFRATVEAIDPNDTAALTAAITAAITANPRLGTPAAGPARGGAEFNGPPAGDKRPATLADAIAARFNS